MNIKVYQSGLKFMLCNAVKRLYNGEVFFHYSLDHGLFATIEANVDITENEVKKIKMQMQEMVRKDIKFSKRIVSKKEAIEFYTRKGYVEKAANALNISNLTVSLFEFEGQFNYFYCHDLPSSTRDLALFDLYYVNTNQVILVYPMKGQIDFTFRNTVNNAFQRYLEWNERIGINYVNDLNKIVSKGEIRDLIAKNDIVQDSNVYEMCRKIINDGKSIILLAGPSSSGKTTTSKKLAFTLSAGGYEAIPISLDDFFINAKDTPLDEDGKPDYESVRALDLELFDQKINSLMNGGEEQLPVYDFVIGEKTYPNPPIKLKENQILVIEGLHAINPEISKRLPQDEIFKVYISPLTPLQVDRHNYVSTTDNRLMRRILRDYRTRGRSAEASILSWEDVRVGEEKYIFPYTDTVDGVINTAYIYELGILKVFIEPLLYDIPMDSPAYEEARRLLDNLRNFYTISPEYIADDNVLREFIGGSIYE